MSCILFLCVLFSLSFFSCEQEKAESYSSLFRLSGVYIKYDRVHYMYMCNSEEKVRDIIKYYYPDCFNVKVYLPGSKETGYSGSYYFATWKSYLGYREIK